MVRCCQCSSWLHVDCIAKKEEFAAGVWCCFECRTVPRRIIDLHSCVETLMQTVLELREDIQSMKASHSKLQDQNEELVNSIKGLSLNAPQASQLSQEPRSHGTLLLGSSLIRDVDETKLVATKCVSISGGRIKDIHSALDKLPSSQKFGNIALVVGGNDCDDREREGSDVTDLIVQYRELIESAKMRADTVTISSVCPRSRPSPVLERITDLNAGLTTLCSELGVSYVDNDVVFYLRDGSLNEGFLLPDHVHLTPAATNRLVKTLGLKLRQGCLSAHTDHRRRHSGNASAPLASEEQGDFNHAFWSNAWEKVKPQRKPRPPPNGPNRNLPSYNAQSNQNTRPHSDKSPTHRPPPLRQGYANAVKTPIHAKQSHAAPNPPSSRNHIPSLLHIRTSPARTSLPPKAQAPPHAQLQNPSHSDICQLCLGAGHSAVTCRGRDATCYKCNGQGHFARACPH